MAFADADKLPIGERMERVGHADKLRRSDGMVCFRGRVTSDLERGRYLWPSLADGTVTISTAQLSYLLSGIDWRMPQETWRPTAVG